MRHAVQCLWTTPVLGGSAWGTADDNRAAVECVSWGPRNRFADGSWTSGQLDRRQTSPCGFAERSNGAPGRRQRLDAATGDGWSSYHVTAQADGIGNQILSRHPILSTDAYHMQVNGPFRRAVTEATWSLAENR